MRGLGPAIQTADEFYKKRIENMPKSKVRPIKIVLHVISRELIPK